MKSPQQSPEQHILADTSAPDAQSNYHFFNHDQEINQSAGAYLPHWQQDGVIYFVTFRLADSLSQEKLTALRKEKEKWLNQHPEPHSKAQRNQFHKKFTHSIHQWLDNGYGSLLFKNIKARQIVEDTLTYFDNDRYKLDAFVVAANHVHVLVAPQGDHSLSNILHTWKGFSAKSLLHLADAQNLSTFPTVWQKESWDHIVRSEQSLQKFHTYIQGHGKHAQVPKQHNLS